MTAEGAASGPDAAPESAAERVLAAADRLFYGQGIRAVGVDALAKAAGVTKRTLYRHFASKDALVAAYLERRKAPLAGDATRPLTSGGDGTRAPAEQILRAFERLGRAFAHADFRGCAFINAAAELAEPDHPALAVAVAAKHAREAWFRRLCAEARAREPDLLAMQLMMLFDGAIATWLVRRDPACAAAARLAAEALLQAAGAAGAKKEAGREGPPGKELPVGI